MDKSLLAEIQKIKTPKRKRPAGYGITYKEYAKGENISEDAASDILSDLVDSGFLVCEENWIWNGKATKIFVRADKKGK